MDTTNPAGDTALPDSAQSGAGVTVVINLTRFGDLLQCQPLIEDLHRQGNRVHLVCLDNFSSVLPLMRHVERAWPLPGARLMADMEKDWRSAAARLLEYAHAIRAGAAPACVVNLTTTLPARLLAGLVGGNTAEMRGFVLDALGFGQNRGIWATFLNSATVNRQSAPFNLVDIFRMVGGSSAHYGGDQQPRLRLTPPSQRALAAADALLAATPADATGFVAMQLGASEQRRQWPAEYFASVGNSLWRERKLCPVLLGSPAEKPLAEAYARHAQGPFVNAVGKTDLTQLAALLCRSRLLLTNDTGTMHLAAGLGVTSLAIFLATAQPCDTGPYLPGCCCLEPALPCHPCPFGRPCPNNLACVGHIRPQSVEALALAWLDTGRWDTAPLELAGCEARVWQTELDKDDFITVRCLSAHAAEDRSQWLAQQRDFWRQILDDLAGPSAAHSSTNEGPISPERPCRALNLADDHAAGHTADGGNVVSLQFAQRMFATLDQAIQLLNILTQQGQMLGKTPKAGQLFLRNCERLQTVLDACPELRSLGAFWRELRQERGERLDDLLALTTHLGAQLVDWRDKYANGTSFA
ncbi:glycosyltransferase family 9 protein [Desulfovibrio sp.]|uniref:glycosyltransferase family 9 protein n=1 Tax=Desulfovibrio sp. TaxID=885 RepID=UPI0035ADF8F2